MEIIVEISYAEQINRTTKKFFSQQTPHQPQDFKTLI